MKRNQTEDQSFQVLYQVVEHAQALRISGLGYIDQRANLGSLVCRQCDAQTSRPVMDSSHTSNDMWSLPSLISNS